MKSRSGAAGLDPRSNLVAEHMDSDHLPLSEAEQALDDLDRTHRWLLGYLAIEKELEPIWNRKTVGASPHRRGLQDPEARPERPSPTDPADSAGFADHPANLAERTSGHRPSLTLLDVGAGSGALAAELRDRAARRGRRLSVVALDRKLSHLLHGRRKAIETGASSPTLGVVASALDLPFRDGAFDVTLSSLLLHHFDTQAAERHLGELRRARREVAILIDLRPSRLGAFGLRCAGLVLGLGPVALEDGVTSFAQSWSRRDLQQLTAGLPGASIRRRFPFRHSIVF